MYGPGWLPNFPSPKAASGWGGPSETGGWGGYGRLIRLGVCGIQSEVGADIIVVVIDVAVLFVIIAGCARASKYVVFSSRTVVGIFAVERQGWKLV